MRTVLLSLLFLIVGGCVMNVDVTDRRSPRSIEIDQMADPSRALPPPRK